MGTSTWPLTLNGRVQRVIAAIDVGAPTPILTTALYERFRSRGEADFGDKVRSAMRWGFGGHLEKKG
jgi:6-phosphogluconate dehydrogenase